MRAVMVMTVLVLAGCASQKLALLPPAGVDLSGHWVLNESESDDPQRLIQNQNNPSGPQSPGQGAPGGGGGNGGGGGGGGGGRGRGRGGGGPGAGFGAPVGGGGATASPAVIAALGEGLRWPGKDLEVKQVAGVVAFTSGGRNRVFTPSDVDLKPPPGKRKPRDGDRDDDDEELGPLREPNGRSPGGATSTPAPAADDTTVVTDGSAPPAPRHGPPGGGGPGGRGPGDGGPGRGGAAGRGRDAPVTACGWDGKTLVVQAGGGRDDRGGYEQRFVISEDGDRLIEIVGRKGYNGEGFTLSRVWDRVVPGAPPPPAATGSPRADR